MESREQLLPESVQKRPFVMDMAMYNLGQAFQMIIDKNPNAFPEANIDQQKLAEMTAEMQAEAPTQTPSNLSVLQEKVKAVYTDEEIDVPEAA